MSAFSSSLLLYPNTARAEMPVIQITSLSDVAKWLVDALKAIGESALLASISTALINTTTYAADRLAYDAAVFVASGGNGEDPLFENRSVGDYFSDYGASVAGEALGAIDDTGILGNFSLCEPNASGVTLAFKFGIQAAFTRPEPSCDFNAVKENWNGFLSDVESMGEDPFGKNSLITTKLSGAFNPGENDFSVGIQLYSDVLNKAQTDAANSTLRTMFAGFFKEKTAFINGKVETPSEMIQKRLDDSIGESQEIRNKIQVQALADPKILTQIAKHAGSVFTNTLLSKVTEKLYDGLFGGIDQTDIDPFNADSVGTGNSSDARAAFREFLTATPVSIDNFSQLGEFSACPSSGKSLYNCVSDTNLVTAIGRAEAGSAMTIAEAIEEDLLNSSWPLIPSSDTARDQDQFCYSYGYCHGNLVKLRKARIISTGWELAAESAANSAGSPVTLGEVVDAFNDCSDTGELDDNHPWCHLIDPNWILKYPATQCKAQVYGEQLVASVTDQRQDVCVDMPSCIDTDSNGQCTGGYGYCVREQNTWQFRGEECPDYYASCLTLEDPEGTEKNFIMNTTNSDNCTADNAGCLWYATQMEDDGTDTSTFAFPDYSDTTVFAAAEAATDIYKNRIYFTSAVAECDSSGAGCRELVSRADGVTLNMISNPSFEKDEDEDGVPDGWVMGAADEQFSIDSTVMLDGSSAVNPGTGIFYQPGIVLTQGAEYTYSVYARQGSSTGVATSALLTLGRSDGVAIDLNGYALEGDCNIYASEENILEIVGTPSSTTYERFSCTFTVPTLEDSTVEIAAFVDVMGGDLWFDQLQLEQESEASDYHEGYSDTVLDLSYVKVAPAYLGCTGDPDTDATNCADYATMCLETDVGCSLYTPSNGDPSVAGITDSLDECPEECVGYDTFKQEATNYEPDGEFPVYFIPDSADTCSAQAVGCDEFTNIATEASSYFTSLRSCITPTQAALNSTTSDDSAVFYTWEGSDTSGYQLKTWNLLESDMGATAYTYADSGEINTAPNAAPCTTWVATATGITCNDDIAGVLTSDSADCDEHDDIITNPDCREFYDASGVIHYRSWSKTVTVDSACVTYRKTDIASSSTTTASANCGNSGGYFDSVITQCRYYGFVEESIECSASESGCREYTGGRSRDSRQALAEYFEDGLTSWDAASATNVTVSNESIATDGHSLLSNAESVWTYVGDYGSTCASDDGCTPTAGTLGGTCTAANGDQYCGTLDDQLYGDKTYTLSFWAKGTGTLMFGFDESLIDGTRAVDVSFVQDPITLDTEWHEYSYGPLDMKSSEYPDFGDGSSALVFTPSIGGTFYLDNVMLREGEDNITVIKNSWITPASCDQTAEGTVSDQYMLGCQEYTDQNGAVAYLKSFNSLCEESQVGCSSYFMTQESDATGAAVYGAYCSMVDGSSTVYGAEATSATSCYYALNSAKTAYDTDSQFLCTIGVGQTSCEFDLNWYATLEDLTSYHPHLSYKGSTVISPADKDVFLVVNSDVECTSDVAGCTEVGLPTFSQDHTSVASWTSTYLMNIPADYATTLCTEKGLYCNAWTDGDGSTHYFKDPQDQTCEYRTDVTVDDVTYDGWFKTGLDEWCATTTTTATDTDGTIITTITPQYVIGGDVSGIWRNGDDDYSNWVGTCTDEYDSCTEYQDLTDLDSDDIYGVSDGTGYTYLNNDSLMDNSLPDSQKCNGQVSQKEGCALFNDSSEPSKTANMSATYVASKHADVLFGGAPNGMVDPIDCEDDNTTITTSTGATVDLCAKRCRYIADDYYDINGSDETYIYDGSCYDNTDCRPLASESNETIDGSCISTSDTALMLENDANTVLKVDRDRECSEWLSCSDSQTTWDERTNSYKTICGDIGLCTKYATDSGNASFCSAWSSDAPAEVLDQDVYSERDVSWYGEDYSGYAIPGTLPVDQLTQKNVAPPAGYCNTASSSDSTIAATNGIECSDDSECRPDGGGTSEHTYCPSESEDMYRLAYVAGACDPIADDYGDLCYVGYCANTGSPCSSTESCGTDGGSCVIGSCYEVSTTACASDTDCPTSGDTCLSGFCATQGYDAIIDDYLASFPELSCDTGETMYPSVNFKAGTCMRNECILTPTGSTFDVATAEAKSCRGYPEINSPFPNSVVETWINPITKVELTEGVEGFIGAVPYTYLSNFENAQVCQPGEDCSCSYKKVTYGEQNVLKVFGRDSDFPTGSSDIGVCVGGDYDGAFCSANNTYYNDSSTAIDGHAIVSESSSCESATYGSGTCTYPSLTNDVVGMDGYCLERDSSNNILGDRDLNACLTWLPVDQLAGSTDLYAKYTSAGFDGEAYYCGEVNLFNNVYTLFGCAEIDGGSSCSNVVVVDADSSNYTDCRFSMQCADGFFAVGGPATTDDGSSTSSAQCQSGVAACPYRCVPMNSVHSGSGEKCGPPSSDTYEHILDTGDSCYLDTPFYFTGDYAETDTLLNDYSDCIFYGASGDDELGITDFSESADLNGDSTEENGGDDYYIEGGSGSTDALYRGEAYPTCQSLLQVANNDTSEYNYAWTDRVANSMSASFPSIDAGNLTYTYSVANTPFGASISPADAEAGLDSAGDPVPAVVAACGSPSLYGGASPAEEVIDPTLCDDDTADSYGPLFTNDGTPQAREYIAWTASRIAKSDGSYSGTLETSEDRTDIAARLQQLFAKPLGLNAWSNSGSLSVGGSLIGTYGSRVDTSSYGGGDFDWDVRAAEGNPPSVWAVDLNNCYNDECEEDEAHALTLNEQNEGDVESEQFYRAYLKFYAAADKNQLPIRKVMVDWGDEPGEYTGSDSNDNFYKNHRGLNPGEETSICDNSSLKPTSYEWGMTGDSCDSNYFSYNHIYTCNPAGLDECALGDDGMISNSPCTNDGGNSCTFRPRVHIRDNWGWCTGVCTDGNAADEGGSADGCFTGEDYGISDSVSAQRSECAYGIYPDETLYPDVGIDPWVYYDGSITITP